MAEPEQFPIDGPLIAEVFRLGPGGETSDLPRHRHDLTREQVETTQKARIILATAEVVTEKSYARTQARDIVQAAGVSSKTFYAHFAGKEEAFLAGYTLLDGVMQQYTQAPISVEHPRTDLRTHVLASLERLAAWPLFTRMRFIEGRAAGRIAEERRGVMSRDTVAAFGRAILEARKTDRRIGNPSDAAISVLTGGISELCTQWVLNHDPSTLPQLAPTIVEAIERFLYDEPPNYVEGE